MDNTTVIGKIVAPHGVRGDIRIMALTDTQEQFLKLKYLLLKDGTKLTLKSARMHKRMILATIAESTNMDEAEKLRGQEVSIYTKDLPPLPEGRFYVRDLVGLPAVLEDGTEIGKFKDTLQTGSKDVFIIVDPEGKEILIPCTEENVKEINVVEKRIVVCLPEWD